MKHLRYGLEVVLLYILFFVFKLLPLDTASGLGGFLGRSIGPRLAASRKALRNLKMSLPDKSDSEYADIIKGMWENLGRVIAEYSHLEKIGKERTEIVGLQTLDDIMKDNRPAIFISGHLANWEVNGASFYMQKNFSGALVYRAPNNPPVDRLLNKLRSLNGKIKTIPKSTSGMREIIKHLKDGGHLGLLIDQKYNEGIPATFFGRPAMTSTAFAELSLKFDARLIPARVERLKGAWFRITLCPDINLQDANDTPRQIEDLIAEAHQNLETWITEHPEQWLWLHRRWDSAKLDQESKNI